jgi:hypothetical protein
MIQSPVRRVEDRLEISSMVTDDHAGEIKDELKWFGPTEDEKLWATRTIRHSRGRILEFRSIRGIHSSRETG